MTTAAKAHRPIGFRFAPSPRGSQAGAARKDVAFIASDTCAAAGDARAARRDFARLPQGHPLTSPTAATRRDRPRGA